MICLVFNCITCSWSHSPRSMSHDHCDNPDRQYLSGRESETERTDIDQLTETLPPPKDLLEIHRLPDVCDGCRTYTCSSKKIDVASRSVPDTISRSVGRGASSERECLSGMLWTYAKLSLIQLIFDPT